MGGRVVKTLLRPDGQRRLLIIERDDGLFGLREERRLASALGERWAAMPPIATLCATAEEAEREARAAVSRLW